MNRTQTERAQVIIDKLTHHFHLVFGCVRVCVYEGVCGCACDLSIATQSPDLPTYAHHHYECSGLKRGI